MIFDRGLFLSCLIRPKDKEKDEPPEVQPQPARIYSLPARPARTAADFTPYVPPPLAPYEHPPASGLSYITELPTELVLFILEVVDLMARYGLMRTCQHFYNMLEPNLFQHLTLLEPEIYRRSFQIQKRMVEKPAYLPRIITYYGPIYPLQPDGSQNRDISRTFFEGAVNIRDLYFTDYVNWVYGYAGAVSKCVERLSLRRLVVQITRRVDVVPLLWTQPKLTHLVLWGAEDGWSKLQKTDIPNLTSLTATLEIAALVVPGRPIEELNIVPSQGTWRFDEFKLRILSKSSARIKTLMIKLYNPFDQDSVRDALQAIVRTLPDVEDLTITVGGNISRRLLLLEIPAFKSITTLTLLQANLYGSMDITDEIENTLSIPDQNDMSIWVELEDRLKERCPNFTRLSHTTLTVLRWRS